MFQSYCFIFRSPKSTHEINAERSLALNHSFHVYFIADRPLSPAVRLVNNTHYIHTQLVPNDFADFSRNSYGQQTINDMMRSLGHSHLDVLRLASLAPSVQMAELLHFMIYDHLLYNVKQLHIAMYIGEFLIIANRQLYHHLFLVKLLLPVLRKHF